MSGRSRGDPAGPTDHLLVGIPIVGEVGEEVQTEVTGHGNRYHGPDAQGVVFGATRVRTVQGTLYPHLGNDTGPKGPRGTQVQSLVPTQGIRRIEGSLVPVFGKFRNITKHTSAIAAAAADHSTHRRR